MAACANCGCDLPGVEKLCRACYDQQYWDANSPKGSFWQRLGRNGDQWVLFICACVIAAPLCYALANAPRLLHGIDVMYHVFLGGMVWIITPWILVEEWKERRTFRTVFVGIVFMAQVICAVLWWMKGTQIWFQINTAIAVLVVIFGYAARAFRFLRDW